MQKGRSLNSTEPKGLSLDLTAENLQAISKGSRGKTKKKPPPKSKGISLNTIDETSKPAYSYMPSIFSRSKTKKKPPPKSKSKGLSLNDEITIFSRSTVKPDSKTIRRASLKVGRFIQKHRSKIRLNFLNTICTDSNVCIAFGKETKVIREFFNNFDLKMISEEPTVIGTPSSNGSVELLTFKRDGYVANAILKTSNDPQSDNLAYEALVGNFINKQKLRFPCFVETYGLYHSTNILDMSKYMKIDINKTSLIKSCERPLSIALMIEYLKNGYTLKHFIENVIQDYDYFMNTHLLYILYQVYAPLSILSDVFTHYDLHASNVMLYPVGNGKHIQYNYHYTYHTVTFNSEYIVKIIDYGRSFFKDDSGYNPKDAYKDLCESRSALCTTCGDEKGFAWLDPVTNHYISSQKRNMSHDLRLLRVLHQYIETYHKDLIKLIYSIRYLHHYGTPERMSSSLYDKILNVNDAKIHIEKLMKTYFFKKNNNYDPSKRLGIMHIYSDGRPMEYIAV
jgi:hypothetical protein